MQINNQKKEGKWGSFFIEKSVDQLMNEEENDYKPPISHVEFPSIEFLKDLSFGKDSLSLFSLDPEWYIFILLILFFIR